MDRIDELRVLYESHLIARADETGDSDDVDHAFVSPAIASYFEKESLDEKKTAQLKKERALHEEVKEKRLPSKLEQTLDD